VIQDLIDGFNFTGEPEKVRLKLRKLMKDSALLVKVDRAFQYIIEVLKTLKSLGMKSPIYLNPLSNYNTKYYGNGIMFQVVLKMDKSRRFSRVATGGRFDLLIQSLMVNDIANRGTAHAVGFSLSSTHLFLFMKALLERRGKTDIKLLKWKGIRCDVLININDDPAILDSAYEILKSLWNHNISCDKFVGTSQEHVVQKAAEDGANWIVTIRQPKSLKKKSKRQSNTFKPVRIKNMISNRDVDVEYEDIVPFLQNEIDTRNNEEESENDTLPGTDRDFSASSSSLNELSPLYTVDIAQKVVVVPNEAPRGRKAQNKREKWEIENDSKVASANFVKSIATSPIISVDLRDEVLDMISMTSIHLQDEWIRKVVYGSKDLPKHFAMNIQNTLLKEHAKGYQIALLVSQKTQKTVLVDLQK
jgi:translation initiation factor 2-alpha kinase 4